MSYFYAQIQSGVVVGVSESSSPISAENMIAISSWQPELVGATYNSDTGEFTQPEPAPPKRFVTKRAFWNRFPALKESVMRAVRMSTPAGAAMLAGVLDRLNSRVDASPYVNLDDAQTIEGIQWLASVQCPASVTLDGVSYDMRLTAQERDAVLLAEIQEHETYP